MHAHSAYHAFQRSIGIDVEIDVLNGLFQLQGFIAYLKNIRGRVQLSKQCLICFFERSLEVLGEIYCGSIFLICIITVYCKLCCIAQNQFTHLHVTVTRLDGGNLQLEIGIFCGILLRRSQIYGVGVLVRQYILAHILVIQQNPFVGYTCEFALVGLSNGIDTEFFPVAMVPCGIVRTGHQLIVSGCNGTGRLEDGISTLAVSTPIGTYIETITPFGVVLTVEKLGQSFAVRVMACALQSGEEDGSRILECCIGSKSKLAHLQPDIGSTIVGPCDLYHEILVSSASVSFVECKVHSSEVL